MLFLALLWPFPRPVLPFPRHIWGHVWGEQQMHVNSVLGTLPSLYLQGNLVLAPRLRLLVLGHGVVQSKGTLLLICPLTPALSIFSARASSFSTSSNFSKLLLLRVVAEEVPLSVLAFPGFSFPGLSSSRTPFQDSPFQDSSPFEAFSPFPRQASSRPWPHGHQHNTDF